MVAGIGLGMRLSVGSLSVLDLRSLDWDSVGDHGNVLAVPVGGVGVTPVPLVVPLAVPTSIVLSIVPGSGTALGLSNSGKMSSLGVRNFGSIGGDGSVRGVSLSLGNSGKVHVLGVGNLSGIDNTTVGSERSVSVDGSIGGICVLTSQGTVDGSKVGSLSSLDFGGILGHSIVDDRGGVPVVVSGTLVDAVPQTSVRGEMLSLSSLNFGCVLGNSCNGGMCGQVGSAGSLNFRGVDWDAVPSDHNGSSRCVVGVVGRSGIMDGGIRPWGAISGVQDLRLVRDGRSPTSQTGGDAQSSNNLWVQERGLQWDAWVIWDSKANRS